MQNFNTSLTVSNVLTTIDAITVDTGTYGETYLNYFFEATTNSVLVEVQGSVNNSNWVTLTTHDLNEPDQQMALITVPSGGSAVAVIAPGDFNGVNSSFRYFRVQCQGAIPFGVLSVWVFTK